MDISSLGGRFFAELVESGLQNLRYNEDVINRMNVFPVPDGDTGTNMRMTLEHGVRDASPCDRIDEFSEALAHGMLLGARGNSGVILSQIFKGISLGFSGKETVTAKDLADALVRGYETAYRAVVRPAEGTMLTVARVGIENARARITASTRPDEVLRFYLEEARAALDDTPKLLPVLREAGVVDSGGMGLVTIFAGIVNRLDGRQNRADVKSAEARRTGAEESEDGEFGLCTEVLLRLRDDVKDSFDLPAFTNYLESVGNSVVALRDGDILKIHVHTEIPDDVVAHAKALGRILNVKVDDMDEQHETFRKTERSDAKHLAIAYVAVASGAGITETLKELGCTVVLNGGQTMNTSAEEFLAVYEQLNADAIIVMPNNPNVRQAALQAKELAGRGGIRVLGTESIAEGYFAMSMTVGSVTDPDEQMENMRRGIRGVTTVSLTRAVRSGVFGGVSCKEGDFIGFTGKRMLAAKEDLTGATLASLLPLGDFGGKETLLLIRGASVSEEEAEAIAAAIEDAHPALSVGILDGGQEVYDLVLGITD